MSKQQCLSLGPWQPGGQWLVAGRKGCVGDHRKVAGASPQSAGGAHPQEAASPSSPHTALCKGGGGNQELEVTLRWSPWGRASNAACPSSPSAALKWCEVRGEWQPPEILTARKGQEQGGGSWGIEPQALCVPGATSQGGWTQTWPKPSNHQRSWGKARGISPIFRGEIKTLPHDIAQEPINQTRMVKPSER